MNQNDNSNTSNDNNDDINNNIDDNTNTYKTNDDNHNHNNNNNNNNIVQHYIGALLPFIFFNDAGHGNSPRPAVGSPTPTVNPLILTLYNDLNYLHNQRILTLTHILIKQHMNANYTQLS